MTDACRHDGYWRGVYGTCMACRAETAEAEVAKLRGALAEMRDLMHEGHPLPSRDGCINGKCIEAQRIARGAGQ